MIEAAFVLVMHHDFAWSSAFYLYGKVIFNTPIWFFLCLTGVELLVFLTDRIGGNKNPVCAAEVCAALLIGYFLYKAEGIPDFFGFKKVVIAFAFYRMGELMRSAALFKSKKQTALIGACALAVWLVSGVIRGDKVSLYGMALGNYWFFIFSGISGSIMLFAVCRFLPASKWASFLCGNSLLIVATHDVIVYVFASVTDRLHISGTVYYDLLMIPVIAVMLIAYRYVACPIVNKYLPILNGRTQKKSAAK